MKRSLCALVLGLTGCIQQQPAALVPGDAPPRVEVTAPDSLQTELVALDVPWEQTGSALPIRPVKAVGSLAFDPTNAVTVTNVRRIVATFAVSNAVPGTVAALEWVAPSGQPYHRDEAPVGVAAPADDRLSFELPVAATTIDSQKLTGVWTVQLLLGGQVVNAQNFELTR